MFLRPRLLSVALTGVALLWVATLIATPLALARGAALPAAAVVYGGASLVCHQRPERSFDLAGTQVPVCARCFALYAAGAAGALAACVWGAARESGGRHRIRVALACAAAPTAFTLAVEWAGLALPSNAVRAFAAVPLGLIAGWIFVRLLNEAPGRAPHVQRSV